MPKNRTIRLLCAISLLQGMVFYAPVATLYRQAAGVGLAEIALLESISLVLSLLLELPWGVVADRIGYRNTMVVCSGLFFLSKAVFWRAEGFAWFLAERLMLAVVISGLSGVDSAMIYLSSPEEEQQRNFALYSGLGTAGMLAASLLYSLCFGGDYRLTAFWTMIVCGAAAVLALFLREPPHAPAREERSRLLPVLLSVLRRPELLLMIFAFACFAEARQAVTVFLNQPQYARCGIPAQRLGYIAAGMRAVGLLGVLSGRLTRALGERRAGILLMGLGAAACAALALTGSAVLSVAGVGLITLAGSLLGPIRSVAENRRVRTAARATELSVYAMVSDALAAGINVAFGRAAEASLPLSLWLGAGLCAVGCAAYAAAERKRR